MPARPQGCGDGRSASCQGQTAKTPDHPRRTITITTERPDRNIDADHEHPETDNQQEAPKQYSYTAHI